MCVLCVLGEDSQCVLCVLGEDSQCVLCVLGGIVCVCIVCARGG